MTEILVFGTFWFWALSICIAGFMFWLIDEGHAIGATLVMALTIAAMWFLGNNEFFKSVIGYAIAKPWMISLYIGFYFVIGTGWAVAKWFFYLRKLRDEHLERTEKYKQMHSGRLPLVEIPNVLEHKEKILTWMIYWMFSMVWTLINDPIRKTFLMIYEKISGKLQSMADNIFKPLVDQYDKKNAEIENERKGHEVERDRVRRGTIR